MAGSEMTALAQKIHNAFAKLGDDIESFIEMGGEINLRVYHNRGSKSIDLHHLNGELEPEFFQVERILVDVEEVNL